MNIVAQVLKSKPDQSVYTTTPMASVFDAITLMAEKNVGGLVVMEGEPVVGIITERDYARKIALMGRLSRAIQDSPSQWLGAAKAPEHAQEELPATVMSFERKEDSAWHNWILGK